MRREGAHAGSLAGYWRSQTGIQEVSGGSLW